MSSLSHLFTGPHGWEPVEVDELPQVIAFANAALPDSDPRKITRETVATLRNHAYYSKHGDAHGRLAMTADALAALADALESYLPPEGARADR